MHRRALAASLAHRDADDLDLIDHIASRGGAPVLARLFFGQAAASDLETSCFARLGGPCARSKGADRALLARVVARNLVTAQERRPRRGRGIDDPDLSACCEAAEAAACGQGEAVENLIWAHRPAALGERLCGGVGAALRLGLNTAQLRALHRADEAQRMRILVPLRAGKRRTAEQIRGR